MARLSAQRLDFIDGLRAGACAYVLVYHLFLLWPIVGGANTPAASAPLMALFKFSALGHIGVNVFLALSGFCLFFPICRRASQGHRDIESIALLPYGVRRARRIF